MQCILTALKAESDPLIDHFNLKKEKGFNYPVFSNNDIFLIGVGIGKHNIKNRINYFMSFIGDVQVQFINIGIAGAKKNNAELGELYCIHKIIDDSLNKSFFPDMLINFRAEERAITTVDKEVNDGGYRYDTLVDMEASEIFKVCSKLVPLQNLLFMKIVSDFMNFSSGRLEYGQIVEFIKNRIDIIEKYLYDFKTLMNIHNPILTINDQNWIQLLVKTLLLTKTQNLNFIKIMKGYRLRNPGISFPNLNISRPTSKAHRNKVYEKICEKFII